MGCGPWTRVFRQAGCDHSPCPEPGEPWATGQAYDPAAVHTFLQVADYYPVAHAMAYGHVVVTHEIASTSTRKIKIPDACIGLGVGCATPFEMLRRERARFVLEQPA